MTAVLEVENKEGLDKLLKIAKIAGIYAKQRRECLLSRKQKMADEEKRRILGNRAKKLFNEIRQEIIDAGETMTIDEINAEIAEARKERAMREKCLV